MYNMIIYLHDNIHGTSRTTHTPTARHCTTDGGCHSHAAVTRATGMPTNQQPAVIGTCQLHLPNTVSHPVTAGRTSARCGMRCFLYRDQCFPNVRYQQRNAVCDGFFGFRRAGSYLCRTLGRTLIPISTMTRTLGTLSTELDEWGGGGLFLFLKSS